jgi:hypothetical protein
LGLGIKVSLFQTQRWLKAGVSEVNTHACAPEGVSFNASEMEEETVSLDGAFVRSRLGGSVKDAGLPRDILLGRFSVCISGGRERV